MKYLAVLGNTPDLSVFELQRVSANTNDITNNTVQWSGADIAQFDQPLDLSKLGGTIKLAEIVTTIQPDITQFETIKAYLMKQAELTTQKFCFGFSVYAGDKTVTTAQLRRWHDRLHNIGLDWKKELRDTGKSVRLVESRDSQLSSVIVKKEHLLDHGADMIVAVYQDKIIIGKTLAVQDFADFSHRDYGRPERDHFSGMLPPKVARMLVNIAQPKPDDTILDPFCGSGTVLQEALTLGYTHVIGADITEKSIADTAANLAWLNLPNIPLHQIDVLDIAKVLEPNSVACVVAEGYLGPVRPQRTSDLQRDLTTLYKKMFQRISAILKPQATLVLALPAWRKGEDFEILQLRSYLAQSGFNSFHQPIIYGRPDAKVVRQIYFLTYHPGKMKSSSNENGIEL